MCNISGNWGNRSRCRNCEALPPAEHRAIVQNARLGKGDGGANNSKGKGKGKGPTTTYNGSFGSFAHRQIQQAKEAEKSQQAQAAYRAAAKELQDSRKKTDGLLEQNRKLQRELAEARAGRNSGGHEGEDMEWEGPEEMAEEDRKCRMDKLRNCLPYLEEHFGVESELYTAAQEELVLHQRALREAKPFKTHRTILERRVEKLKRLQEKDKERLGELRDAAEEIKLKVANTAAAVAERARELDAAETELKELVLRSVGEETSNSAVALPDPEQGWAAVVGNVARLAQQPGVPQQFSAQIEGMLGQLQHMVAMLQAHATAGAAAAQNQCHQQQQQHQHQNQPHLSPHPSQLQPCQQQPGQQQQPSPPQSAAVQGAGDGAAQQAAEERKQQRRAAWRQQKSTEAIAEFERRYRAEQQAAAAAAEAASAAAAAAADAVGDGDTSLGGGGAGRPQRENNGGGAASSSCSGDGAAAAATPPEESTAAVGASDGVAAEAAAAAASAAAAAAEAAAAADPPGTASAAQQLAPSSPAVPAGATEGGTGGGDCDSDLESDVTGALSEGERDRMEVDQLVAAVSPAQRAAVRALLDKRKERQARRLARHKKPEGASEANPRHRSRKV